MNCEYCGAVLADGETECPSCGAGVTIPNGKDLCAEMGKNISDHTAGEKNARIRRCSGAQCRTPIPEGSSVCPKCGLAYNETIDRALCAAETPLAPGAMYAIAGIMVAVNAILFAVSEFLFPEIRWFAYIAGICVIAIPVVIFYLFGTFGFRKQTKAVKYAMYAAFGIAALLSCVNFCWNSVLMSKYSLFCALRRNSRDYKFAPSFQWRKGIGFVQTRELYRLRSGYRYWYFAYNNSTLKWKLDYHEVDPDLALNWIRKSNENHFIFGNLNPQKKRKFKADFETYLKKDKLLFLRFDKKHELLEKWYPLAKFRKNPEFIIDRIRKHMPLADFVFDTEVVFE